MSPHGTTTRYNVHACRCSECRAANANAMRLYRSRHPEERIKATARQDRSRRAMTKLAARHPEEYMQLLAEEPL